MKRLLLAALLCPLAPAAALAGSGVSIDSCSIESDYDLRLGRDGITLRRDDGQPAEVRLQGQRLWIDGEEVLNRITVIGVGRRFAVFERRANPDRRTAEVADVIQSTSDALDAAALELGAVLGVPFVAVG